MGKPSLLDQIEEDAMDGTASVAGALRKCIALGSRAGSSELRDWANRELRGYGGDDELPNYRIVGAPILVDALVGNGHITGQVFSSLSLPDFVQEAGVSEQLKLLQPIGELEDAAINARKKGEAIHMALPETAAIAEYMNQKIGDPFQHIERIYWAVSPSAIAGILDQVRTTLVELVAELREEAPGTEIPTADTVANALSVVVQGRRNRVTVAAQQAADSSEATMPRPQVDRTGPPWWRTTKAIWSFAIGAATIAAAIIAWFMLQH